MRILLVHNRYQQAGGEDVVFEQERRLLESAGHNVFTYQRSNWEIAGYSRWKRPLIIGKMLWARDTRHAVAGLIREKKPDVVHIHNTFLMVSPSVYTACTEARVPIVQTLHNYRLICPGAIFYRDGAVCEDCLARSPWRGVRHGCYRGSRGATAAVALMVSVHRSLGTWSRKVRCFIAPSAFSRQKFIEAGLPAHKILVKPNFLFADPECRKGAGEYALFIGRLSPEKRVLTMLEAWKQLTVRIPLLIIGGGPQFETLRAYAKQKELLHVHFRGQLPHDEVIAALNRARFSLFTSEWYETFGMTMIEAFACGVPVIASRLGTMQEIVSDGRTGLHFAPGEAADLAHKVEWAWTHPDEMAAMGRAARAEYEAKYTAERNYARLMDIYQCAIDQQRAA